MLNEKILEVKNLKQHFTVGSGSGKFVVKAVDDISFDIRKGEVFGLVGESGCGKTTTGRTIIKLYEATDGEIIFKNQKLFSGVKTYYKNIKQAKKQAKIRILECDPFKIKEKSIEAETARKLAKLDSRNADQKNLLYREEAERLSGLKDEMKRNPNQYTKDIDKINSIKQELKGYIDSQKELIKKAKEENKQTKEKKKTLEKIQMIFQDPISSLNPRMTVKEIISEGLIISGEKDKAVIEDKVFKALRTVGLTEEHAYRYPHEFSGGQRQRIGIARALIVNPELLIADEPISALDVSIQAQVINLLKELQETMDLTILFIAHDLSVVKYFSDRIGVMYFGKMVELAPADELFKNPLHPYTKSLLSAIPVPDPIVERKRTRFSYDPTMHNYGDEAPEFVEVNPGHFVLASKNEISNYLEEIKENDMTVQKNNSKSAKSNQKKLYKDMTVKELKEIANDQNIKGYRTLTKKELIDLLEKKL